MVDRNSPAYQAGSIFGRILLISLGYTLEKRWGRKLIKDAFPGKKINL